MRTLFIAIVALTITITGFAKGNKGGEYTYKQFYRQYRDADDVVSFKIPAGFASFFIDKEDVEAKEFMKKMDDISFFICQKQTNQMILDLNRSLPEKLYKEIMIVKDGDTEVTFMAKEEGEFIGEVLMAVYEPDNLVVMCITGEFTKEDAKKIAKSINTDSAINFNN
ncbi:MAG: DUF4252 domain-containing protein [Salinivirgaceae bacterium]|nr:DUF4252 domain-containing protein [Salinivirgaceae bacterium]